MTPAPPNPETLYDVYRRHPRVRIDSREVTPGDLFFALRGRTDGNRYAAAARAAGAAYVVVDEPAVVPATAAEAGHYLLVPDTLAALQQLATRHRSEFSTPVLAITGSNGKTTTKELVRAVMQRRYRTHATPGNYNNHIGLPLTLLATPPDTEFLILEMGANHRGEIAELCRIGRPTHGLITNVGDAHLEGFGGREGVRRGKGELYDYLAESGGTAFVNADEDHLTDMAARLDRLVRYLDSDAPTRTEPGIEIKLRATHPTLQLTFLDAAGRPVDCELRISGRHNLQNAKTAVAVGRYFKVPAADIAAALAAYAPTNQRSQSLSVGGVDFLWDAYNANPSSVLAALAAFARGRDPLRNVVILGEMLELGAAAPAAHRRVALRAGQVARRVLLVGEQMRPVAREFDRPFFADAAALRDWFWRQDWSGQRVFVKGSRGNRLEELIAQPLPS